MKSQSAVWAISLMALSTLLSTVAAGRLALRPLTPQELRRALGEAGVNTAELKPVGRATPSALAGLGGFALGAGGALFLDFLASNETAAYFTDWINSLNSTATNGDTGNSGTTQEVCFASRSLNGDQIQARNDYDNDVNDDDVLDFENDDDLYDDEEGRQLDNYYDSDYADAGTGGGNGVTCIVVNRGRALVRHRRSVDLQSSPKEDVETTK